MTDYSDPRIGLVIDGKYRVEEELGQGGVGTIYRGTRLDLGESVALKFLHRMFASTNELRARFKQEAKALARLRHPSIVALLDFGELGDDELYMVMELVKGETLAAMLENDGVPALSLPFVGVVFDQLLEVLDIAHTEGIIHRDLKPSNVMIIPPSHVKLLDFGLVHLPGEDIDRLTRTGVIHGTPDYMSPEQCQGETVDAKTDVYALGAMLYESLVGKTPFEDGGGGVGKLMAAHLFLPPPSLPKEKGYPAALDALVRSALAKSPEQRPSAKEMRSALTDVLRGTDAITITERAAEERSRAFSMNRSERAVTGRPPPVEVQPEKTGFVLLDLEKGERASAIRSALAVNGIQTGSSADEKRGLVVRITTAERYLDEPAPGLNLVIDVADTSQMRECIRAGASDIVLARAPDSDIPLRALRLLRRRR